MDQVERVRARADTKIQFPPYVWRHIKYFMLREFWQRKYRKALTALPRHVVLSTWTRRYWNSWSLEPHPHFDTVRLKTWVNRLVVDYEGRDRCDNRPRPLGPQQTFYIVVSAADVYHRGA